MVMRASFKTALRLFKKHLTRLLTIVAIVIVSVGFMSGIGEVQGRINFAANKYYRDQNMPDFYIKSARPMGFTANEISEIEEVANGTLLKSLCFEEKKENSDKIFRVYQYALDSNVNQLEIIEGELPKEGEVLAERATVDYAEYTVGDKVTVMGTEYTVSGICINPMLLLRMNERSFQYEEEYLSGVFYLNSQPMIVNDVYYSIRNRTLFDAYSEKYKTAIEQEKSELCDILGENATVLTLYENEGFYAMDSYAEKVGQIGIIFVVFFLLVTLLVVYSTMSRLFDEERGQIACMKTLGYSDIQIVGKYVLFVTIATLVGGAIASVVGLGLTYIIYVAFGIQYDMPPFPAGSKLIYYFSTFAIILVATLLLTLFTGLKLTRGKPAALLTPKAPKMGKKVILERIKFIWNRLSFKHKSTARNVLLFKGRFFMTVVSLIGSSVLVLAGLGLTDNVVKVDNAESILSISIALIVFSAMLCALVVYNLTNINVSERTREIATLMVLGYSDREVTTYIFREVYLLGFIGAILGLPFGYLLIDFVFNFINFGNVADINWWSWILAPLITMFFCCLSTLLLYRKIIKTDMNASLKTLE